MKSSDPNGAAVTANDDDAIHPRPPSYPPVGAPSEVEAQTLTDPPQRRFTIADLRGVVPALPGRETVDFDELIAEALEESADQTVRQVNGE